MGIPHFPVLCPMLSPAGKKESNPEDLTIKARFPPRVPRGARWVLKAATCCLYPLPGRGRRPWNGISETSCNKDSLGSFSEAPTAASRLSPDDVDVQTVGWFHVKG